MKMILVLLVLSACASASPSPQTLTEKLAGKNTSREKRDFAERMFKFAKLAPTSRNEICKCGLQNFVFGDVQQLCGWQKMKKAILIITLLITACANYQNELNEKFATVHNQHDKEVLLASECQSKINSDLTADNQASVERAKKMQEICEEMTG